MYFRKKKIFKQISDSFHFSKKKKTGRNYMEKILLEVQYTIFLYFIIFFMKFGTNNCKFVTFSKNCQIHWTWR